MIEEIYILDLIGTFAFAVYGSYFAIKEKFDIFGIFVSAFLTAVGGGTIRELLLNNTPFYFFDFNYIYTIIAGLIFTILIYKHFSKIKVLALLLDSVGLITFAFIGASIAYGENLGGFGIIFFAVITAVGGGILRDIILNKTPIIFKYDLYATIAILIGIIYSFFSTYMQNIFYANLLIIIFIIIRLIIIFYKIHLWKPQK